MKCMNRVDIKSCKAACCGPVPINKEIIEKYKNKLNKEAKMIITMPNGEEIWTTDDATCGFLDEDYTCKIYENRPFVCRLMGEENPSGHIALHCSYLYQPDNPETEMFKNKGE